MDLLVTETRVWFPQFGLRFEVVRLGRVLDRP